MSYCFFQVTLVPHKEFHANCFFCFFVLISVVGMGSWCFHMTLKYEMQVSNEKIY